MRLLFWTAGAALTAAAGLGLARNDGNKFVRINTQQGCIANYVNIVDRHRSGSVCCTGAVDDDGVCFGGRTKTTKILTSKWAFVIPLLALATNAACDKFSGGATPSRTQARWNRFWLYVVIILARTGILYLGLNYVENLLQREETNNCWYAHLRRSGRCSEHFDFADHVVLGVCQYFAIQVFELYCIDLEYRDLGVADAVHAAIASRRSRPSFISSRRPTRSPLQIVPAVAVCCAVAGCSLLLVYNTASFFHSRAETAVALLLSWCAVGSHLAGLMGDRGDASGGVGTSTATAPAAAAVGRGGENSNPEANSADALAFSPCRGILLAASVE